MKTFLFSYDYEGTEYSLEIPAESQEEAQGRVMAIWGSRFDGVLDRTIDMSGRSQEAAR